MRAVDCFCGAGGLTRGLLDAGIEVVAGFDLDERCKETHELNNRPARFYSEDRDEAFAVPYSWIVSNKNNLNMTDRGERSYWHITLTIL